PFSLASAINKSGRSRQPQGIRSLPLAKPRQARHEASSGVACGFLQIDFQVVEGKSHGLQETPPLGGRVRGVATLGRRHDGSWARLFATPVLRIVGTSSDLQLSHLLLQAESELRGVPAPLRDLVPARSPSLLLLQPLQAALLGTL